MVNLLVPTGVGSTCLWATWELTYSTGRIAVSANNSRILLCASLEGEPGPAPRLHYCFLTAPSCLCSCSLPGLDGCLNLLFETQGRGHRQVSVLRSPMGSCLVSFSLSWLPLGREEELPLFSRICSIFPFIFQWVWLP